MPKFDASNLPAHNNHYQVSNPFISRCIFRMESSFSYKLKKPEMLSEVFAHKPRI